MNFLDKVQCYRCRKTEIRGNTLILDTPKGRFRLCRECYAIYENSKANEQYATAKENIKKFNILSFDAYELMKRKEDFLKKIEEGRK